MSFFGATTTPAAATTTAAVAEKDVEMADPPTDSISSISFSSQADYLAVGSWDNSVRFYVKIHDYRHVSLTAAHPQVRIYEVMPGGQSQGKAMYQHQGPVMSVCWNKVRLLVGISRACLDTPL